MKDYRDPNNNSEIQELEKILDEGPLSVVLVYADWCPHCHHYMPFWDKLAKTQGRIANMIALNEQVLPNTSVARAEIDSYPSIVVIDRGSTHREFAPDSETVSLWGGKAVNTNIVPYMHDEGKMIELLKGGIADDFSKLATVSSLTNVASAVENSTPLFVGGGILNYLKNNKVVKRN